LAFGAPIRYVAEWCFRFGCEAERITAVNVRKGFAMARHVELMVRLSAVKAAVFFSNRRNRPVPCVAGLNLAQVRKKSAQCAKLNRPQTRLSLSAGRIVVVAAIALTSASLASAQRPAADDANLSSYGLTKLVVRPGDWPQWGGTSLRNNAPHGKNIPTDWRVLDENEPGQPTKNIKWSAKLGSLTFGSPVVANGKVYVGTNNPRRFEEPGFIARFPEETDLGCLLCFDEQTGKFRWQHSTRKLVLSDPPGFPDRARDWPMEGIHAVPLVDGDRLWYLTNRCEVVCLDTAGFTDGENDGPFREEESTAKDEADVVWKLDLIEKFGVHPHQHTDCSVTCAGDILFVITGNGVAQDHRTIPSPKSPSFMAIDRHTARVLWTDNSPGNNILHGTWGSPTYAVLGGRPQVLMMGGDGWLYSFDPRGDGAGKSKLWWKLDGNPKDAKLILGGRGTRNEYLGAPVVYDRKVYFAMGQDPEHGEGLGRLWCVEPTKHFDGRDVSEELIVDAEGGPVAHRRMGGPAPGEQIKPNPSSAVVWCYTSFDLDGNGKIAFEEEMHRTCSTVAIKDDLLYVADMSGLLHCVDAQTGKPHWTHDLLAAVPGWNVAPLIVDGKVYIADEEGKVGIFALSNRKQLLNEVQMSSSIETTPIVANDVLLIATRGMLYAIATEAAPK